MEASYSMPVKMLGVLQRGSGVGMLWGRFGVSSERNSFRNVVQTREENADNARYYARARRTLCPVVLAEANLSAYGSAPRGLPAHN